MTKINVRTIINIFTLIVTFCLLIFVGLAWYVSNSDVSTSNIVGISDNDDFAAVLEYGGTDGDTFNETGSIADMNPGDVHYYRLRVTVTKDFTEERSYSVSFRGVESLIDENILGVENNHIVRIVNSSLSIPLYEISNGQVLNGTRVVYNISNNTIELGDFKLEDKVMVYKLNEASSIQGITGNSLNTTMVYSLANASKDSVYYWYFGLSFIDDNDSNYYLYQRLVAKNIYVSRI